MGILRKGRDIHYQKDLFIFQWANLIPFFRESAATG
jgi:hypothetical protein